MEERSLSNLSGEDRLRFLIDYLADQLCLTVDGNFDFAIKVDTDDETVQKLEMLVNFVLDSARRALAENAEKARELEAILNSAADVIITIDERGEIQTANTAAQRTFGYAIEELIGSNVSILMPREEAVKHDGRIQRYLKTGEKRIVDTWREVTGRRKDGTEFPLEVGVVEMMLGEQRRFTGILHDITDRKRTEDELRVSADKLSRALDDLARRNTELDEFTYVASHDLQEPLRKLTAYSGMLREDLGDGLSEEVTEDLDYITDAAERMHLLVQDLLTLSRVGKKGMKLEEIALQECVDQALETLELQIKEAGAEVSQDELPTVWGDRTMLTQLYQNLISNGVKFSNGRKPHVQLTARIDNGHAIFGVKDNGIGIEPRYAEQIFAPFKRLHGRSEYPGTGIGLSICRKTVERHGGEIWVESKPDHYSHFLFTLPMEKAERAEEGEANDYVA